MMETAPVAGASRREWYGLAVLTLPTMLAMMDISVLFLALPQLTRDLDASATQQIWISDIYGFLIAGFLVTMGTLGDRIGRRKVLLTGAALFGAISVLAAYSSSAEMLIISRALLGVAGATIMPSTLALIMEMFHDVKQRGIAIAVWASALTLGVALGPIVGGVLLHWFWWGSVFLIGVPVMLLLLATGPVLLPEFKNPAAGRLDLVSVVLILAAILPFMYGFQEIARSGWEPLQVVAVLAGLAFGVAFVIRQRGLAHPLLDIGLFAIRAVAGALLMALFVAAIQAGTGFFITQYLQIIQRLSPLRTGLWLLVPTMALVLGIFISQGMAQKIRPAYILTVGALIAAVGMVVLSRVHASSGLSAIIIGFTIVYIGVAPVGPLISQLVVPSAPKEKAGSASSLQSTSGELGAALGIAILGTVGMAVYRGDVDVPSQIAGTAAGNAAGDSLVGAVSVAPSLPSSIGASLVDSAERAFTSGMNTAALVSAIGFVCLAVLAFTTLRHLPPMAAQPEMGPPAGAGTVEAEPNEAPVPMYETGEAPA